MRDDVFDDLNRHVQVSRETFSKLVLYHDLLLKWQARVNLVGPDTVPRVWRRHFLDSLQLLNHLPRHDCFLLDIGSGAGFPGMVLAICGLKNVWLAESDQKKITFLREVSRVTETPVKLHAARVETLISDRAFDVITSRACSSLATLCEYSHPNVSHETLCLFPKGRNYTKEIEEAHMQWGFELEVAPSVCDAESVILKLRHLTRRGHDGSKQHTEQS